MFHALFSHAMCAGRHEERRVTLIATNLFKCHSGQHICFSWKVWRAPIWSNLGKYIICMKGCISVAFPRFLSLSELDFVYPGYRLSGVPVFSASAFLIYLCILSPQSKSDGFEKLLSPSEDKPKIWPSVAAHTGCFSGRSNQKTPSKRCFQLT